MHDLNKTWSTLIKKLELQFDSEMTLKGVLYLIGVQELNLGVKQFAREEKLDVLHVAVCKILAPYGYYRFDRLDKDGWPHYTELKAIKKLSNSKQEMLMKEAIINYLN